MKVAIKRVSEQRVCNKRICIGFALSLPTFQLELFLPEHKHIGAIREVEITIGIEQIIFCSCCKSHMIDSRREENVISGLYAGSFIIESAGRFQANTAIGGDIMIKFLIVLELETVSDRTVRNNIVEELIAALVRQRVIAALRRYSIG